MATGTLTGSTIAGTYKSLLKVTGSENEVLDASTTKVIEDGDGNPTPLKLSQDTVDINSGFELAGSAVTASATELNYVGGVTSAIQTQIDAKAPLASPTLTGTPIAPTAGSGTDTTQIATTAFVQSAVQGEDTLAEMNDTTLSSPIDNDFLVHDGTDWKNESASTALGSLGVTASATELNVMDGSATTQATVTLAGTDGVVISDGDTMKQALVSDFEVYMEANLDTMGSQFTSASALATVGTIGTGTWEATDVAVAHGGTGASTFTDGGILLGSGTSAITATAVLGDGEILIGDGTTDPVALDIGSSTAITIVGALASGSIASGFGVIDNGTSGIRTNTFTAETSIIPDASGGADIGSTSAEWGDVFIADDKKIKFGNDQDFTIEYDEDGSDIAQFAGADIGMNGKYLLNEQGRQDHVANTMSAPYYRFDGVNDEIAIADNAHMSFGDGTSDSPFSVSAWINMEDASDFQIFNKGIYNSNGEYRFECNGSDKLSLLLYDESGASTFERATTTASMLENKWIHVCATYSGVGGASANAGTTLYVNGVSQALSLDGSGTYVAMENGASEVRIGNYADTTYAQGSISSIKVHNLELSATEVKELYSGASVPFKYKGANQTELITNGDIETNNGTVVTGWGSLEAGAVASIVTGNGFTGDAQRIVSPSGGFTSITTNNITLEIGKKYKLSFKYRSDSSAFRVRNRNTPYTIIVEPSSNTGNAIVSETVFTAVQSAGDIQFMFHPGSAGDYFEIDDITLTQIGAVAEYDGSGVGSSRWDDKSGNELHGTVSGATVENAPADADSGLTYEEGEHSATVTGETSGNFVMDTNNTFRYTKIGRLVHIQGVLSISSDNSASGDIKVSIPFASGDGTALSGRTYGGCVLYNHGGTISGNTSVQVVEGDSFFKILEVEDDGTRDYLDEGDVDTAWDIGVDFCYTV